jgi:hypothetical protein
MKKACRSSARPSSTRSAGFGLVKHQKERAKAKKPYLMIDAIADFRELTDIKIAAGTTGLFMVGGGVPKNFAQDTVVCAEILGVEAEMHKLRRADHRRRRARRRLLVLDAQGSRSWGKVQTTHEQMVFAEATTVVPLIGSDAYHRGAWKNRKKPRWAKLFEEADRTIFRATRALKDTPRWQMAVADLPERNILKNLSCAIGADLNPLATPKLTGLLLKMAPDVSRAVARPKALYSRQRPYLLDEGDICADRSTRPGAKPGLSVRPRHLELGGRTGDGRTGP